MAENSAIQWCHHTFNAWWGCARVSPGCRHCYAADLAHRYGHDVWHRKGERRMLSDQNWAKPIKWNRDAEKARQPALVFCSSMADVFEDHPVPEVNTQLDAARARLWDLIEKTPWLRWQLLTKRPQNVQRMVPWGDDWPTAVWLGVSAEDQRRASERLPLLLGIPARTRFVSAEPLLEQIDLSPWMPRTFERQQRGYWLYGRGLFGEDKLWLPGLSISWVICGGESGPKHRPMDIAWARSLRDQCADWGVPFLFKQHGGRTSKAGGRELDGRVHDEFPTCLDYEAVGGGAHG